MVTYLTHGDGVRRWREGRVGGEFDVEGGAGEGGGGGVRRLFRIHELARSSL